jgi:transketolase C-terminal domain/subunit
MIVTQSKQLRATYGEALVELGAADSRVVVVDADMAEGTMTGGFKERFPERFFDVGVAEQNLMGVGVGLSLAGWIPFVNTFAWLLVLRAGDPLRTLVSYARANVKVVAGYGGRRDPPVHHGSGRGTGAAQHDRGRGQRSSSGSFHAAAGGRLGGPGVSTPQ